MVTKDLPEWFQMLEELFSDLNVYSSDYYDSMNCESILNQARYAALRDKNNMEQVTLKTRDAVEHCVELSSDKQTCPVCAVNKMERVNYCSYCGNIEHENGQV